MTTLTNPFTAAVRSILTTGAEGPHDDAQAVASALAERHRPGPLNVAAAVIAGALRAAAAQHRGGVRSWVVYDLALRDFTAPTADDVIALWSATAAEQAAVVELHHRLAVATVRLALGECITCGGDR